MTDHKLIRLQIRFIKSHQDIDIDNLPTRTTQTDIRRAATSRSTIEKIKNMKGDILQKSMLDIIGDDIQRKPLMDQWYKQPKRFQVHKDNSAILLGDTETQNRWEQIAQELQELMSQNKIRDFFQMANRVT